MSYCLFKHITDTAELLPILYYVVLYYIIFGYKVYYPFKLQKWRASLLECALLVYSCRRPLNIVTFRDRFFKRYFFTRDFLRFHVYQDCFCLYRAHCLIVGLKSFPFFKGMQLISFCFILIRKYVNMKYFLNVFYHLPYIDFFSVFT